MTETSRQQERSEQPAPETVCSEEEFSEILGRQIPLLIHVDELVCSNRRARLSRRLLATVCEEATELEELLTDFDAPYNRTFGGLFELVAALSSFSAAGYVTKNIEVRTLDRSITGDPKVDQAFAAETQATLDFVESGVRALLGAIVVEAKRLCGPGALDGARSHIIQDGLATKKLPHSLGAEATENIEGRIALEASLFLTALKTLEERSLGKRFDDVDEMRHFVLETCDEEQARFFEAKMANIQSRYDSFIMNSVAEERDPALLRFRFIVGTALDLIRVVTRLVHFYERHEDDLRSEEAKERVAGMIDKELVLDRILNYALYYAQVILRSGRGIAQELLASYTVTVEEVFDIPEGVVLHARPASMIVKVVNHHGTPVEMQLGEARCYAGSIMQVLTTAGANVGERRVTFSGDRKPVEDLRLLFAAGLGERGFDDLPPALSYLRP